MPAFDQFLKSYQLVGKSATRSSTPPVIEYYNRKSELGYSSTSFAKSVIAFVAHERVPHVVLIGRWSYYIGNPSPSDVSISFEDSIVKTVETIRAIGTDVWVMLEIPGYSVDVPRALAWSEITGRMPDGIKSPIENSVTLWRDTDLTKRLKDAGARILDPGPWIRNQPRGGYRTHDNQSESHLRQSTLVGYWCGRSIAAYALCRHGIGHVGRSFSPRGCC